MTSLLLTLPRSPRNDLGFSSLQAIARSIESDPIDLSKGDATRITQIGPYLCY
jgi:hypothetical protein